ncbi:MAG: hypothetical protein JKY78_05180 [Hyphomonas sp.]|nr:hypothetical protein [Hyphomonas sp.]
MLRQILSTGVAILISGNMASATTVRSNGSEAVSELRETGDARLKTFVILEDQEETGTTRCELGFQAPDGGVFLGPVPN